MDGNSYYFITIIIGISKRNYDLRCFRSENYMPFPKSHNGPVSRRNRQGFAITSVIRDSVLTITPWPDDGYDALVLTKWHTGAWIQWPQSAGNIFKYIHISLKYFTRDFFIVYIFV